MKKILYDLMAVMVVLSMGMFISCSEDNDGFITATEDDFPQILLPWFGEWENGEPAVYKNISRDIAFIDSVTVTPALYTTVEWLIDDEKIQEGMKIQHTFLAGEYILKVVKLHGTNMEKVTKISIGDKEATTTFRLSARLNAPTIGSLFSVKQFLLYAHPQCV